MRWLLAHKEQFSHLMRSYGYLALATYLSVYVVTLCSLWLAVLGGWIGTLDVVGALSARLPDWAQRAMWGGGELRLAPWLVKFFTAWLITKTTEPLRLVTTIALVPLLRRHAPTVLLRVLRALPESRGGPAPPAPPQARRGK